MKNFFPTGLFLQYLSVSCPHMIETVHSLFSDGVLDAVLDGIKISKFLHRTGVFSIIDPVL